MRWGWPSVTSCSWHIHWLKPNSWDCVSSIKRTAVALWVPKTYQPCSFVRFFPSVSFEWKQKHIKDIFFNFPVYVSLMFIFDNFKKIKWINLIRFISCNDSEFRNLLFHSGWHWYGQSIPFKSKRSRFSRLHISKIKTIWRWLLRQPRCLCLSQENVSVERKIPEKATRKINQKEENQNDNLKSNQSGSSCEHIADGDFKLQGTTFLHVY